MSKFYEYLESEKVVTQEPEQIINMKEQFFSQRRKKWLLQAVEERDKIIKEQQQPQHQESQRLGFLTSRQPSDIKHQKFTLSSTDNIFHGLNSFRQSFSGGNFSSLKFPKTSQLNQNIHSLSGSQPQFYQSVLKNSQQDKTLKSYQIKIKKELTDQQLQDELEKRYQDFYFYKTYKNEERVQLKKRINDETIDRQRDYISCKVQELKEERKLHQQQLLTTIHEKVQKKVKEQEDQKLREEFIKQQQDKIKYKIELHESILMEDHQRKYQELTTNTSRRQNQSQKALNSQKELLRNKSQKLQLQFNNAQNFRETELFSQQNQRENHLNHILKKQNLAEERKFIIEKELKDKFSTNEQKYQEIYEAYERGMQEIKEMFRKRIHQRECLLQQRQADREQQRKEKEEQSKLKEWETYMNVTKVKRQQQQYSNEMQVKLQKQQARVDQFLREKELIIQRGHYNIIVEQMRKQLMKETFKEMEIRNKYQEKLLEKIDQDFKNELINEQDQQINEVELQQRYISLFNLMSNYQKMQVQACFLYLLLNVQVLTIRQTYN
eukprot:403347280